MERELIDRFKSHGLTLACAESCTGGLITKRLTDVPGASAVLTGGVCAYSNSVKTGLLHVSERILCKYGAVSAPVAVQMAHGVMRALGSDIAVAVTGIAGPSSDLTEKPVGLVYIAVGTRRGVMVRECRFSGTREEIRNASADTAIGMLLSIYI